MTEKLQQIIKEEMAKLPKEVQDAINAFDWVKITEEIGKNHSLYEDNITNLQVETMLVLVGLERADWYLDNIKNNVILSEEKTKEISNEIFQKIFSPINKILEENIKKNLKNKTPNHEQNLNFILSGGDYGAFLPPSPPPPAPPLSGEEQLIPPEKGEHKGVQGEGRGEVNSGGGEPTQILPPRPLSTKSTPQERNKPPTLAEIKDSIPRTNI